MFLGDKGGLTFFYTHTKLPLASKARRQICEPLAGVGFALLIMAIVDHGDTLKLIGPREGCRLLKPIDPDEDFGQLRWSGEVRTMAPWSSMVSTPNCDFAILETIRV